jgi:hypothetical protein
MTLKRYSVRYDRDLQCVYSVEDPLGDWVRHNDVAWAEEKRAAAGGERGGDELARLRGALQAAQSFIADGGLAEDEPGASIYREITAALKGGEAGGGPDNLPAKSANT